MADTTAQPRLALGQMNPQVGAWDQNTEKIVDLVRRAGSNRADLLVLPYGALTGFPLADLPRQRGFVTAAHGAVQNLARRLESEKLGHVPVILGHDGPAANRGDLGALTPHVYLIENGSAREVEAVDHVAHIECAGLNVGVLTQQDMTQKFVTGSDLDLMVVLGAVAYEQGGPQRTAEALVDAAQIAGVTLAFVNLVGGQDELVFSGGSLVIDAAGTTLTRSPLFAEDLNFLTLGTRGDIAPEEPEIAQTYRAITLAIADYVAKNGFTSVVLGLSGGIDSALAAAISADALGGPQVTGIAMPSPYSSAHSLTDAADLAKRIAADYREVRIGGIMEAFTDAVDMPGVAGENLQARIRGTLLMGVSNVEGHLVLAPGNKTELAVGYSTIYGDAVGGFGPLKDVYKTRIWALARWRNNLAVDRNEVPPIPESSITKPPSAELRPDQVDQDSLPEYSILDPLLKEHLENRAGRTELLAAGYPQDVVDWALRAVRGAEWKRRQYPVGPKVTARSFDAGRRVPITNNFRDTEDDHV